MRGRRRDDRNSRSRLLTKNRVQPSGPKGSAGFRAGNPDPIIARFGRACELRQMHVPALPGRESSSAVSGANTKALKSAIRNRQALLVACPISIRTAWLGE